MSKEDREATSSGSNPVGVAVATQQNHSEKGGFTAQTSSACSVHDPGSGGFGPQQPAPILDGNGKPEAVISPWCGKCGSMTVNGACPACRSARHCKGCPPDHDCDTLLGGDVEGELCAHCQATMAAYRVEEDLVSEVERNARREAEIKSEAHAVFMHMMVTTGVLSQQQADVIMGLVWWMVDVVGRSLSRLGNQQEEAIYLAMVKDLVSGLGRVHVAARKASEKRPAGGRT